MGCRKCGGSSWDTIFTGKEAIIEGFPMKISLFMCKGCNSLSPRADVQCTYEQYIENWKRQHQQERIVF